MLGVPAQSSGSLSYTSHISLPPVILLNCLHLCQGRPPMRLGFQTQRRRFQTSVPKCQTGFEVPHCNSASSIPQTSSDKRMFLPLTNLQNASSYVSMRSSRENTSSRMRVPQTSRISTVFLHVRYIHRWAF